MGEPRKGRIAILLLATLILLTQFTLAANVGVSPAAITFKNVLRDGYAERPITVTIDTEDPTEIEIETYGDTASWLNYSVETLEVSKGNPLQIIVSVSPPSDTPNGNYSSFLRIKSAQLGTGKEGYATGLVIPTLDVHIITQVTDQEILNCQASNFQISNTEEGDDIVFAVNIKNKGNIMISPKITLNIWDQTSTNLMGQKELYPTKISPTQSDEFTFKISSDDLDLGQYWVDASVPDCSASSTLTFDILEEGALYAAGTLEKITVEPWATIDDIVTMEAIFKNTGEKALDAKFSGQITYENKIIQLLESDEPLFVPIGEQDTFLFYFTPTKAGKYVISGRVFYDSKRTYEQSAVLNVTKDNALKNTLKIISYIALIFIISILIYKIRKERKSYFKLKSK